MCIIYNKYRSFNKGFFFFVFINKNLRYICSIEFEYIYSMYIGEIDWKFINFLGDYVGGLI